MPTVFSAEDMSLTAPLALFVQHQGRVDSTVLAEGADPAMPHVYSTTDPVWVRPGELAPFTAWSAKTWRYDSATPSPHEGCLVLAEAQRAVPECKLLDPKCPTLSLTHY